MISLIDKCVQSVRDMRYVCWTTHPREGKPFFAGLLQKLVFEAVHGVRSLDRYSGWAVESQTLDPPKSDEMRGAI